MATVLPTKGNLLAAKRSREIAVTGHELMDRKRNILVRELVALIDQAEDIRKRAATVFPEAYAALRTANITQGECDDISRAVSADNSLSLRYRSVMGVEIPLIASDEKIPENIPYGVASTTAALDDAYIKFRKAKNLVRDLAETENAIYRLAYAVRKTQKRANALKNIIIPKLDASISGITESLDEKEREEFVRLKVIKVRKQ
ncbi:MAG: V-type ATP synthase subunit D [Oscillospiraceae bacterium]|nr:V-type ATP synthase subunit D [Oscillospiraceae bacterium]